MWRTVCWTAQVSLHLEAWGLENESSLFPPQGSGLCLRLREGGETLDTCDKGCSHHSVNHCMLGQQCREQWGSRCMDFGSDLGPLTDPGSFATDLAGIRPGPLLA